MDYGNLCNEHQDREELNNGEDWDDEDEDDDNDNDYDDDNDGEWAEEDD